MKACCVCNNYARCYHIPPRIASITEFLFFFRVHFQQFANKKTTTTTTTKSLQIKLKCTICCIFFNCTSVKNTQLFPAVICRVTMLTDAFHRCCVCVALENMVSFLRWRSRSSELHWYDTKANNVVQEEKGEWDERRGGRVSSFFFFSRPQAVSSSCQRNAVAAFWWWECQWGLITVFSLLFSNLDFFFKFHENVSMSVCVPAAGLTAKSTKLLVMLEFTVTKRWCATEASHLGLISCPHLAKTTPCVFFF